MARLTNEIRRQIITKLLDHGFSKRHAALRAEENALALELYNDIYSPEIQAQMQALPAGFLQARSTILCQFGNDCGVLFFKGDAGKRMAEKHVGLVAKVYSVNSHFAMKYAELDFKKKMLSEERIQAKSTADGILYSVHTVEKLLEAWPECKPFVEAVTPMPKPLLPALPIPEINAMLGLTAAQETKE